MGWAEELESQEAEPTKVSPWAVELDAVEKEPEQPERTMGQQVFDTVLKASSMAPEAYNKITEIEDEVVRSVGAGLYKAAGDLMALGSAGIETIYDAGRVVGREGYKLATDTPESEMKPFELTNYFSKNFKETTKRDVPKIAGEQGTLGGYVQKIAEYAAPTQAITRQLIKKGAALNAAKSPDKVFNIFEKSMMAAARNPTAAIKMEQGVSALMASAGETVKNLGVGEGGQLAVELATGLASGQIFNTVKSIGNFIIKKVPGSAKRIGRIQAAEYLQEVFAADPKIYGKLKRGLQLQKETGIEMTLDELTNNPELKAALQLMEFRKAGSVTAFETKLEQQTAAIKKMFPSIGEYKDEAIEGIFAYKSDIESKLSKQAVKAVDNVLDQIDNAAPLDKEMLGESGRAALDASREASEREVRQLYKEVGNPNLKTNNLVKAVQEAKKSTLVNDAYMKELDADLIATLESNVLGKTGGTKVLDAPVKKIYLSRGSKKIPTEMSLDAMRTIESRLKERIRIANAGGKLNESRLLNKILNGVFEQYKATTGIEAHQISNLKKAAAASKRLHNIFDQGEVLLQSRIDVKGMERITTEGFVRNFIKPNSDTKLARTNEAVDGFYNAYGDMPEAKQWFINSFGSLLKEEIAKHGDNINPKAIKRFINKHSAFLKRARIEGKFDNITDAVEQAKMADDALTFTKKEFEQTVMSSFIGASDPVNFVVNSAQTGNLPRLIKEVGRIPNPAKRKLVRRGIREALWEGVQRKLTTSKTAGGEEILLNTGAVRKMLDPLNYGKQLKEGLGGKHYSDLRKLIDIVDRVSPLVSSTAGLPKQHIDEKLVEKLMTGLRAAAHGFVRPDLIAAQMSLRGYKAVTTKQAHNILKEAMNNPDVAKELLNMSTSIKGKEIIGTMFSPLATAIITDKEDNNQPVMARP